MIEEKFILFDRFLVKKSDIIYATDRDDNSIELFIKKGNDTQKLTMRYSDSYDSKQALRMLATETDAATLNYYKTAIIEQMSFLSRNVRDTSHELEIIKKELNSLRLELRRNRLTSKKDKGK